MASSTRRWYARFTVTGNGRLLRAVALAILVLLAPMGSVGDSALAHQPAVQVATDENYPKIDQQPAGALERLHAAGITGDNVTVGVLDVTQFDTTTPALSGQVAATKSFGPGRSVPNLGQNVHGTATASIVANVAPDAEFYLASFSSQQSYEEAFEWLLSNEVDVIVAPVSFYGQPRNGDANITAPIERARTTGTTVIAAAGNLADSYWRGSYNPGPRGRHRFDGGSANALKGNSSRAVLWLSWNDEVDADFTIELYEAGKSEPIARSSNYTRDVAKNERLVENIDPNSEYYFVVRGPVIAASPRITVESPTHTFEFGHRHGSVTQPAVHDDVISVGAYDIRHDEAARYSSAGPVNGTPGVDVLGPTNLVAPGYPDGFEGTSSSAAYVGGLAALIHDVDPDAESGHIESLFERSARDVGRAGPDTVNGYGVVQPERLIRLAQNESTPRRASEHDE